MQSIKYDFSNFLLIMDKIRNKNITQKVLNDLKDELNRFFKDSKCQEVLYTNTGASGMFFGMCVIPNMANQDDLDEYLFKKDSHRMIKNTEYLVELDSKLLDPIIDLNKEELLAILLHEVGHIVNDSSTKRRLQDNINYHIGKDGVTIQYNKINKANRFNIFGIIVGLRKIASMFEIERDEKLADSFVVQCGFSEHLDSALKKTIKKIHITHKSTGNKMLLPIWVIKSSMRLEGRRREIIKQLEDTIDIEQSTLIKRHMTAAINQLKKYVIRSEEKVYIDATNEAKIIGSNFINKLKYSSLKRLEEDFYEFVIRINNIDNQLEAMDILRSINMRLTLIEEYIDQKGDALSKNEEDKLRSLSQKYKDLRTTLIKKGQYDKHQYGLFIKYPDVTKKNIY